MMQMGFLASMVASFAGEWVLPPPLAAILNENKGAALMAGMGMNMVSSKLVSTGAFEVLVNGIPIHSKVPARWPARGAHAPSPALPRPGTHTQLSRPASRPHHMRSPPRAARVWSYACGGGRHHGHPQVNCLQVAEVPRHRLLRTRLSMLIATANLQPGPASSPSQPCNDELRPNQPLPRGAAPMMDAKSEMGCWLMA